MRGAILLVVLITPALCPAQDLVRVVQTSPFSTTAPLFVPMSGVDLHFTAPGPDDFFLLLWKAQLANSSGGNASTEIFLTTDGGSRWGYGSSSGRAANETQAWANYDWDFGRDVIVYPMVRAVDGGTATVTNFEAVALMLGPQSNFKFAENFAQPFSIDDSQWTAVVSTTVPGTGSGQWLCLAQATVEPTNPRGVSLRVRVGTQEFPVGPAGDPRARFLNSSGSSRTFFFAAPLTLMPNDTVVLEGTVNPRASGAAMGLTAGLRDVRLLLIPQSVLDEVDEVSPSTGFNVAAGTQVVGAQLPRTTLDAGWELLTFSVVISGDGGTADHDLLTEPGNPPFVRRDVVSVNADAEHPLLGTWVLRPLVSGTMEVAPQWWTRSFGGGLQGWGSRAARWQLSVAAPDAGVMDAGVVADAGTVVDAGLPTDAGVEPGDAGSEEDAGVVQEPRHLGIGCSCDGAPLLLAFVLLPLVVRRRR
ncbi:MAG: hypothetical protein QM817_35330 [Archangium sp.]